MYIRVTLRQLLKDYKLDYFGVEKEICDATGLHRHTVSKILNDHTKQIPKDNLGLICAWLIKKRVPEEILPGALFSFRPNRLWQTIGNSDDVLMVLGVYEHIESKNRRTPAPINIAWFDADVASRIIQVFTSRREMGNKLPNVRSHYVPFRYQPSVRNLKTKWFEEDKKAAKKMYKDLKKRGNKPESIIYIGSQRANYLVECFVADQFGCEPFKPEKKAKVPFYLCYRDNDWPVTSCFGGKKVPSEFKGVVEKGIYYIDDKGKWQVIDFQENKKGAGVVIILDNAGSLELAVFGFSGRSTTSIGKDICRNAKKYWQEIGGNGLTLDSDEAEDSDENEKQIISKKNGNGKKKLKSFYIDKGREIAIYLCEVTFSEGKSKSDLFPYHHIENDTVKLIPLSEKVLKKYLKKKKSPEKNAKKK